MLAFRSEAHVDRWCEMRAVPKGATFDIRTAHALGRAWYADRLSPTWHRRTPEDAEEVFGGLGLTGDLWRLTG
jgi:hypothetical protein